MSSYDDLARLRADAGRARDLAAEAWAEHQALVAAGAHPAQVAAAAARARAADGLAAAAQAALDAALAGTVLDLDPAVPLLLLPVRLETRYRSGPSGQVELLVRVYPEVDVDEHEAPLTPAEVEAGTAFWRATWAAAGDADRLAAWTRLVTQVGDLRAAWVRRELTPENDPASGEPPRFPQPAVQAHRWMRARQAVLPPDRWVAHAYRGGARIATAAGGLVTRPLPAGPDPSPTAQPGADGALVDPGMRWMVDFEEALECGMGLVLPLPDRQRVDLVVVAGVRGTRTATEDAAALSDLLTAHRYHAGLDLVAAGTPTNNTDPARSGHGSPDPTSADSYAAATGGPWAAPGDGSDADRLAQALGMDLTVLGGLPHAGRRGVGDQADLATVLWPGTWGYYLTQLLRLSEFDVAAASWRRWVLDTVRPAGPLPTIRVGDQPYGTLPVTSLARWRSAETHGNLLVAELVQPEGGTPHTVVRVLGELDAAGTWTFYVILAADLATPPTATGVAAAARDLDGDGRAELLIGYAGTAEGAGPAAGVVRCPLFTVLADRVEQAGTLELPPVDPPEAAGGPTPHGLGLALGSLTAERVHAPEGRDTDVVAVVQTPALGPGDSRIQVHVGRQVDQTGTVRGGWAAPLEVTDVFAAGERVLGAELLDGTGGVDLVVLTTGGPPIFSPIVGGPVPLRYRVAHGLRPDGAIVGGWSDPVGVGFPVADGIEVVGAAASVDDTGSGSGSPRIYLSQFSASDGVGIGAYMIGSDQVDGVPTGWAGFANTATGSEGPGRLLGATAAFAPRVAARSPAVGLSPAAGRVNLLAALAAEWRTVLPGVARVRPGDPNPSRSLLDLLSTDDVSGGYQARPFIGPQVLDGLRFVLGHPPTNGQPQAWAAMEPLLARLGLSVTRPPRLGTGGFTETAVDVRDPFVVEPTPGWELRPAPWVREMLRASPAELHGGWSGPGVPLLARLVRHSLLQAYADAAFALVPVPFGDPPPLPEPELVDLADVTSPDPVTPPFTLTSWRHLSTATLGGQPVAEVIHQAARSPTPPPEVLPLAESLAALRRLAGRPAGELARLAAATLDAATHRLDAWITAVATDRLRALRAQTPTGLHVGGYGFVTNLEPSTSSPSTGFVHAPSPAHAATAGVLRSGFLTHEGDTLAVDLSSTRVRAALEALDAVREGQPLGAILGYRFERDLHDRGLARYLPAFRQLAPQETGVLTPATAGTAVERIGGLVTVDGLALLRLDQGPGLPWGTTPPGQAQPLPAVGTDDHTRLTGVLGRLRDGADAVADLGIAESVHQTLQRNHLRAGGSLDALSRGELPPPEPEVVRTPRTGTGVTHRVLAVTVDPGEAAAAALAAWTATDAQRLLHARARAEPRLNGWAAQLLGDPARVRWRAGYRDPATGELTGRVDEFTLAEVGLCPLDVVAAATPAVGTLAQTDLGCRLRRHAARQAPAAGRSERPEVLFEPAPHWAAGVLSVPELLTVAESVRAVIAGARAATRQDLAPAGRHVDTGVQAAELQARAAAATKGLGDALTRLRALVAVAPADQATLAALYPALEGATAITSLLDLPLFCNPATAADALDRPALAKLDELRDGLELLAGFGVPGATPAHPAGADAGARGQLLVQARAAAVEAATRLQAAGEAEQPLDALAALFSPGFRALPLFTTGLPAAVPAPSGATPDAVEDWFEDAARVREPTGRLSDMLLLTETTGGPAVRWDVLQQPAPGTRWVALPVPAPTDPAEPPGRIPGGTVSVVLAGTGGGWDPGKLQAMLAIDAWVEVVPNREENTAVAFHFDAPANCAPQALLLAVHPDPAQPWDDDTVADVVRETAELASVRMVDPHLVPALGQLLPALLLAHNVGGDPAGDTISTSLRG